MNGCVYYNNKDYCFKRVQSQLQKARDRDKYLGKDMDAFVLFDIDAILKGSSVNIREYTKDLTEALD